MSALLGTGAVWAHAAAINMDSEVRQNLKADLDFISSQKLAFLLCNAISTWAGYYKQEADRNQAPYRNIAFASITRTMIEE